jgi:acetylornithine aminotransferase
MKMFDVYSVNDISIVTGRGSWVYDTRGEKYLDMYGGHAVISIGHSQPDYVKAVTEQLGQLGFYSNSVVINQPAELAAALGRVSGLGKGALSGALGGAEVSGVSETGSGSNDWQLFLCNSGAEANENALKLASFHTGRRRVISVGGAFHGRTSLAVAATDNRSIVAPINETNNVIFTPFNDIAALEQAFETAAESSHGDSQGVNDSGIAAVIVEAIQGVAGIMVEGVEYLRSVRRLCDKYGAVYIADEIQCGCGRTGRYFATDWADIRADIYTMAKGIGNGFPMGALAIAPHIRPRKGMLGTTFGGNQLACVAATAVARVIERDGLMVNALKVGEYLMDELSKIHGIRDVRGRGLMIGFEVNPDFESVATKLLFGQRVFVGTASGGRVIRLLPALNITRKEADVALDAIRKVLIPSC